MADQNNGNAGVPGYSNTIGDSYNAAGGGQGLINKANYAQLWQMVTGMSINGQVPELNPTGLNFQIATGGGVQAWVPALGDTIHKIDIGVDRSAANPDVFNYGVNSGSVPYGEKKYITKDTFTESVAGTRYLYYAFTYASSTFTATLTSIADNSTGLQVDGEYRLYICSYTYDATEGVTLINGFNNPQFVFMPRFV